MLTQLLPNTSECNKCNTLLYSEQHPLETPPLPDVVQQSLAVQDV